MSNFSETIIYPVTAQTLAAVGTVVSGTWNADVITETYGGTGQAVYATGDTLYASGVNTLAKRAVGAANSVYIVSGGVPTWGRAATGLSFDQGANYTITSTNGTAITSNGFTPAGLTNHTFTTSSTTSANYQIVFDSIMHRVTGAPLITVRIYDVTAASALATSTTTTALGSGEYNKIAISYYGTIATGHIIRIEIDTGNVSIRMLGANMNWRGIY